MSRTPRSKKSKTSKPEAESQGDAEPEAQEAQHVDTADGLSADVEDAAHLADGNVDDDGVPIDVSGEDATDTNTEDFITQTEETTMAYPTAVNNQITDAVTQSNVQVLAEAPTMAMGALYQASAHSTGILFENAVSHQQASNALSLAIVANLTNSARP